MIRGCLFPSTPLVRVQRIRQLGPAESRNTETFDAILSFLRKTPQRNRNELSETTVNKRGGNGWRGEKNQKLTSYSLCSGRRRSRVRSRLSLAVASLLIKAQSSASARSVSSFSQVFHGVCPSADSRRRMFHK
jgi:hypothetical protein